MLDKEKCSVSRCRTDNFSRVCPLLCLGPFNLSCVQDKTCLLYPCPNAEENPYVQMDNTVEVDRQALEDARRSAEERRGSGASGAKK